MGSEGTQRAVALESAVAGTAAWAGSLLGAVLYVASDGWTGVHDLARMALWSLPFAVVISLTAQLTGAGRRTRGILWAYGSAAVLGPVLGVGCFAAAVAFRGGWVVAFPVFSCWAFGGLLGLVAAALMAHPRSGLVAGGVSVAASVALLWSHAVLRGLG